MAILEFKLDSPMYVCITGESWLSGVSVAEEFVLNLNIFAKIGKHLQIVEVYIYNVLEQEEVVIKKSKI